MSKNSKSDMDNSVGDNISIDTNFGQNPLESNVKYEKLVQDYVKLRSKLTILKKAYVELSESSAQKDQSIRKYEQEIEGLNFRNQQLTARVEILQRELDNKAHSPNSNHSNFNSNALSGSSSNNNLLMLASTSSSSSSSTVSNTSNNNLTSLTNQMSKNSQPSIEILAEELQHKINENQTLHRHLNELEVDLRQKLVKNEQSLKQIEYEKLLLEKKIETTENSYKSTIEKLENDKIKLELNIIQLENQIRTIHQEKEIKESELLKKESEHNLLVQQHAELHKNSSHSSLNSALTNTAQIKKDNHNQEAFLAILKTFLDCLVKVYPCLDERVQKRGSPKLALKCEQLINQIQEKFKNFNFNDTNQLINDYFEANHKLFLSIINDLINGSLNESTIGVKNSDEMDKLKKKLKIYLNKLDQFFFGEENQNESFSFFLKKILNMFISSSENKQVVSNEKLFTSLKILSDILDKLLFALNEKLSLEYSLEYPSNITTIDECLVSYLNQIKQSLFQLSNLGDSVNLIDLMVQIRADLSEELSSKNISDHEDFQVFEQEIDSLNKIIYEKDSEIKAYELKFEGLRSKSEKDEQDIKDLRSRLEKLQAQLLKLEETEILQEQEILKLKNSAIDIKVNLIENKITPLPIPETIETKTEKEQTIEDIDNQLENSTMELYEKQIDTLNKRIQYLDTKAFYYYDEMKCMLERFKLQIDINNTQSKDLNEVKDQLDRTRSSYELQMSTMSDHLIEMSDRMTKQAEENEKLKHTLDLVSNANAAQTSQSNSKNAKTKKK